MAKKKKVEEQLMLDGVTPPSTSFIEQKKDELTEEIDPNQITFDEFVDDSILEKDTVQALMQEAVASEQKTTKKKSFITNTIFLNALGSIWFSDYAMLMLGLVISTVPVILIFLICSKPFGRAIIRQ